MSRLSLIESQKNKIRLHEKFKNKIRELKIIIISPYSSISEKEKAKLELDKIPKNAFKCRQRNFCPISGRMRGFCRRYGVGRMVLKELVMDCAIPGVGLNSW